MGGFWGIEVKPGKQYPIEFPEDEEARLRITQATLGLGDSKGRSIVQCSVGDKSPIFLCSLVPKKNESCPLNLEFEEDGELVTFSVIGKQSVHLSGYFETYDEGEAVGEGYESDSSEEDIGESGSQESSDYGSDDQYELIDSDLDMDRSSPPTKSGVIIEEIEDDDKPTNGKGQSKPLLEFNQSNGSEDNTKGAGVPVLESEDDDGFPISTKNKTNIEKPESATGHRDKVTEKTKKRKAKDGDDAAGLKRKVENIDQDHQEGQKKSKKKQQLKDGSTDEKEKQPEVLKSKNEHGQLLSNKKSPDIKMDSDPTENQTGEKKKKKKKKKKSQETEEKTNADQTAANMEKSNGKSSSKVRTFPNGLVIEEVSMGRPDGKRADPGKKVSVRYIGKLKNGKQFDANVIGPPFKFTLGVGQVISGWDVGVKGMRVGDKRRLTVPPSMGYGQRGAPPAIPPNSWLVFDVELVAVN
ncbi:putative peptidylprolyl isomerase [Rosa chinensis]|uniref:FK506-binding protein n=1 Tax=Rosa chinensis TaxID=74649 RepID=A0A2P6SMJ4_ROSCH|nr:peptidyl-prolyl cis-trans isomerase FKBP53 isoform X2 [Rosa chinensis]PRQ59882.1 putative peptidylprolyl isomerase [Rosa chinensis]